MGGEVFGRAQGADNGGEEGGGEQPAWNPPALLLHDEEDGRQVPEASQSDCLPPQPASPLMGSSHPYSRLIATLASSYSSPPNPKPQTTPTPPQPKRMREESPIDLSPTADSEDLLDVVSVDDHEETKVREKEEEEQERRERAQKLQRLIAAAMFHRGQR